MRIGDLILVSTRAGAVFPAIVADIVEDDYDRPYVVCRTLTAYVSPADLVYVIDDDTGLPILRRR